MSSAKARRVLFGSFQQGGCASCDINMRQQTMPFHVVGLVGRLAQNNLETSDRPRYDS
jgi:hypothetical protein